MMGKLLGSFLDSV